LICSPSRTTNQPAIKPVQRNRKPRANIGELCSNTIFPNVVDDHQLAATPRAYKYDTVDHDPMFQPVSPMDKRILAKIAVAAKA